MQFLLLLLLLCHKNLGHFSSYRISHGLNARKAVRTKSTRPKGPIGSWWSIRWPGRPARSRGPEGLLTSSGCILFLKRMLLHTKKMYLFQKPFFGNKFSHRTKMFSVISCRFLYLCFTDCLPYILHDQEKYLYSTYTFHHAII